MHIDIIVHMCYSATVQERANGRHEVPEPQKQAEETEDLREANPGPTKERIPQLTRAVEQLLDALERCAGDPPDCPHCGPARSFAEKLLRSEVAVGEQQLEPAPEQNRLSLYGRIGAEPSFRVTPKGSLIARFPLAVHNPDNSTTWHQVLAFNQRAERLKDVLRKGEPVQVVGYTHTRESRGRDGQMRTIAELYAVTVTAKTQ